jgi:hypothetical protein
VLAVQQVDASKREEGVKVVEADLKDALEGMVSHLSIFCTPT